LPNSCDASLLIHRFGRKRIADLIHWSGQFDLLDMVPKSVGEPDYSSDPPCCQSTAGRAMVAAILSAHDLSIVCGSPVRANARPNAIISHEHQRGAARYLWDVGRSEHVR
jgi:hypothetical protein